MKPLMLVVACAALGTLAMACGGGTRPFEQPPAHVDRALGRAAIEGYGCAGCHNIPGVTPKGNVGPPLEGFARHAYVAGVLPNTVDNVARWVADPRGVAPSTAMPNLGVTPEHAQAIAAYLATLK